MLGLAAGLPDALIRALPDARGAVGVRSDDRPQPPRQPLATPRVEQDRVEDGTEDVVLALVERAVADPYRTGPGIAGELVPRGFGEVAVAVDPGT